MAAISATLVKELRERTGAGMMDCKRALQETDGDIELAVEHMRKSGQAKADKKSGRVAAEGAVLIAANDNNSAAVALEVNCETDFVARDENFLNFAQLVCEAAVATGVTDLADIAAMQLPELNRTVEEARLELVAKLGENIQVRRIAHMNVSGNFGSYIHSGRIGVIVDLVGGDQELAKSIAMHIAASNPIVVSRDDVSEELINKEREIFTAQAQESGKPADIIAKMIDGRISKYLDEVSLLGQPFVKDPSLKVGNVLKTKNATVKAFIRFMVGEGIEKREDNFAEEVMAQVKDAQEGAK